MHSCRFLGWRSRTGSPAKSIFPSRTTSFLRGRNRHSARVGHHRSGRGQDSPHRPSERPHQFADPARRRHVPDDGRGVRNHEIHEVVAMFIGLLVAEQSTRTSDQSNAYYLATNGLANPMVSLIEDGIAGVATALQSLRPGSDWCSSSPPGSVSAGSIARRRPSNLARPSSDEEPRIISETPGARKPKRAG